MGLVDSTILNYASWSISVEFYTYILFAATCVLLQGKARIIAWTVLSIAGISVTIWASFVAHGCLRGNACYNVSYDFGYARCVGAFFLGALVFRLGRAISFNTRILQFIVTIALVFFFVFVGANLQITMCFPILCALIVLSISRDTGPVATGLQHKWFQVLGQRSFSIYMLHPVLLAFLIPTATVIDRLASPTMAIGLSIIAMAFYITILVVVSGWTYTLIEAPTREWFNRYAARKEVNRVVVSQS
jgi:peptidoglycan/LPS O-acetylase OafA/YrhL